MTLTYIAKSLNTHEKCVRFIERIRWGSTPVCPYCLGKCSSPKSLRHTCHKCKRSFSVRVGTVFHNSNLPLQKWLMAITIMLSAKKGVSSLQLARDLSVNKNTAWLLQMKIRAAMKEGELEFFEREFRTNRVTLTRFLNRPHRVEKDKSDNSLLDDSFSYWRHLKRALFGQYHRIDEHYLHRYVDEIVFQMRAEKL
jgi:transposase-like protein